VGAPVWSAAVAGTVTAGGCFLFDLSRASLRVRSHQGRVDSLAWRKRAGIRDPGGGFGDCPGTRHLSTDRAPVPGAAHARCVRERGETARLGLTVGMVGLTDRTADIRRVKATRSLHWPKSSRRFPRDPTPFAAGQGTALARYSPWVLTGSNRRHSPCKGDALPAELSTHHLSADIVQTISARPHLSPRARERPWPYRLTGENRRDDFRETLHLSPRARERPWPAVLSLVGGDDLLQASAVAAATLFFLGRGGGSCRSLGLGERDRLLRQRERQHLVDPLDGLDLEIALDVVRDLDEVLLVLVGDQHRLDTATVSGQELLLQATDGQYLAAQGDLTRHGDIGAHRNLGQRRDERRAHADTRARAVLGRCAFGDVQVDVMLLIELTVEPQHLRAAAHHSHRCLDRLLHHLAQLAGVLELALAGDHGRLDGQQLAADLCPGETRHLTHAIHVLGLAVAEAPHAEELVEIARRDRHGSLVLLVHQHLLHGLAADLGDLALQIAHARLARVVAHDVEERRVRELQLVFLQAVALHLLRHEVAPADVHLLVLGVPGEADHLHAVEERSGNVHAVGGADEHDLGEVEVDLEVVVVEGRVLLRIEDLEQRR